MTVITLTSEDLDHFRLILREALAGDHELLRNLLDGFEASELAQYQAPQVASRLAFLDRLAAQVGGLY